MSEGRVVAFRDLSQPDSDQSESPQRNGELLSSGPDWTEFELTDGGAPIPGGTPVEVQTSQTIYLGLVESVEIRGTRQRLRVRVYHWLALEDIASVQKLWSQDQSD